MRTDGAKVVGEFIDLGREDIWLRSLRADRAGITVPLDRIAAVEFGDLPLTLVPEGRSEGALVIPPPPHDMEALRWLAREHHFAVLLRTVRGVGGTANPALTQRFLEEIQARLARRDLSFEERRDLRLAETCVRSVTGTREQRDEARKNLLPRLRQEHPRDPVVALFGTELLTFIAQEAQRLTPPETAPGPGPRPIGPLRPGGPPRPDREGRNDRPGDRRNE